MTHNKTVVSLASVLTLTLAATAPAATLRVPAQHDTIQAAVDAASPGDKIVIKKGVYTENVVVLNKAGLQFIGKGSPIWDGSPGGVDGDCLTITTSDDVTVRGFTFRNGTEHISSDSNGLTVTKCRSRGAGGGFVEIVGNDVTVEKCNVSGASSEAVDIDGDDALVQKNSFSNCGEGPIEIDGDRATITKNRSRTCEDGPSIDVSGNDVEIVKNRLLNCGGDGIEVDGNGGLIQKNLIDRFEDVGIDVSGDDVVVDRNRILGGGDASLELDGNRFEITKNFAAQQHDDDSGFEISGTDGLIERNRVFDMMEEGYELSIDDTTVRKNLAQFCGTEGDAGFEISGDGNTIENNTAKNIDDDGFNVDGSNNVLTKNSAIDCDEDGFDIDGSAPGANTLDRCKATGCIGEGLDNSGTDTTVTKCRFLGNRIDLANDGTFANDVTSSGNRFGTGGPDTAPEIE